MIYEINCGHCNQGKYDGGAIGNGYREQDLTRLVGNIVMAKLRAQGHTVINCTVDSANSVNSALNAICAKADAVKADIFVSIHLNASNSLGHGTEIFTYGAREIPQARKILNNIVAMGFTNRGIKDGSHLAVVKNTDATSMLVELCFIDNVADMQKFNDEKMADAIVLGLTGQSVSVSDATPIKVTPIKSTITVKTPVVKGNANVLALQKLCNSLGIRDKNGNALICDSYTGELTRSAVEKLPACGIKYTQPVTCKVVQKIIGCKADGVFWKDSEVKMRAWQSAHGCEVDGVCGKESFLSFLK